MVTRQIGYLVGCAILACGTTGWAGSLQAMKVSTPAFASGAPIPAKYARAGQNKSPGIGVADAPAGTRCLVLIVEDPDSPSGLWTHWLMWNVPPATSAISEGKPPAGGVQGKNSFGNIHYDGPAPPSGTHRYFFRVYALDTVLSLPEGSDRVALQTAMKGHVLGKGETLGTYSAAP